MLAFFLSGLDAHFQSFCDSLQVLKRRSWNSLWTILVLAAVLFLICLFSILQGSVKTIYFERSNKMDIYLKTTLTEEEEKQVLRTVETMPGVINALLITKEQSLEALKKDEALNEIIHYLPQNPLPAVIQLQLSKDLDNPLKDKAIFEKLHQLPQIDQIGYDLDNLNDIYHFIQQIRWVLDILLGLLILTIAWMIHKTLTVIFFRHIDEIHILTMMGATQSYIIRPFFYLMMSYALAASLLAIIGINGLLLVCHRSCSTFSSLNEVVHYSSFTVSQAYFVVLISIASTLLFSGVSLKKLCAFLK